MKITLPLLIILTLLLPAPGTPQAGADPRPNILWLSCEDIGPNLGCYGDPYAITPNLDQLAERGIRYTNAFTVAGVCAPNRSSIISGIYASTLGTHHMRSGGEGRKSSSTPQFPAGLKTLPELLRGAGYYCINNYKEDYNFDLTHNIWDESGKNAHWMQKEAGQPFFAVFNYTQTHESTLNMSAEEFDLIAQNLLPGERQNPLKIIPPPYYPNTDPVRRNMAQHYESITILDKWIHDRLQELEEAGLNDNTIVFFWSDHGAGMPRAKRWVYDSGIHVPLIIVIPEKFRNVWPQDPGSIDDRLVSSLDLAPTALQMAGIKIPEEYQGVAVEPGSEPRAQVYAIRDRMDERYETIRAIRTKNFKYIKNFSCDRPYYQYMQSAEKSPIMKAIRQADKSQNLPSAAQQFVADRKPDEEFYDVSSDPYEVTNLAAHKKYQAEIFNLKKSLYDWMIETRDLGLLPETELVRLEKISGSRYAVGRSLTDTYYRKLLNIADCAGSPREKDFGLISGTLNDKDISLKYWALTAVANYPDTAAFSLQNLSHFLTDPSPVIRLAVAKVYCQRNLGHRVIPVLKEELGSKEEWVRLQAAILIDEHPDLAQSLTAALQEALHDQENKYVVRVVNHTLNRINETADQVR